MKGKERIVDLPQLILVDEHSSLEERLADRDVVLRGKRSFQRREGSALGVRKKIPASLDVLVGCEPRE